MPIALTYLLKLSVSLAVVFLFYHFVLRKLTFYNWNRWYLLGYTLLSFFIPFINISPVMEKYEWSGSGAVSWLPAIGPIPEPVNTVMQSNSSFTVWQWLMLAIPAGMLILLIRLVIQYISYRKLLKKANLISTGEINFYEVNEHIIPFSFGNSIFINRSLHTETELEDIIRHEVVHVKQKHSWDIIWGEVLCLINWYNPFVWLIRKAIRQNLEFIADKNVLDNGVDKKEYQFLLLKVIGNNQVSIANQFNFSSLKKRITMMNKNKSAKKQLFRFLFLLPVLAVILVSFRNEIGDTLAGKQKRLYPFPTVVTDTIPEGTIPNNKGYIINVKDKKGECLLVIKDKAIIADGVE